jgi:hypothetical protein
VLAFEEMKPIFIARKGCARARIFFENDRDRESDEGCGPASMGCHVATVADDHWIKNPRWGVRVAPSVQKMRLAIRESRMQIVSFTHVRCIVYGAPIP